MSPLDLPPEGGNPGTPAEEDFPAREERGKGSLSRTEFDILSYLAEASARGEVIRSQRQISEASAHSLGTVNRLLREFAERGFADKERGEILPAGLSALEPYRVRRAVFLAAGFGSRMVPITLNTPKPLVRVGGVRIIDSLLDACVAAGIEEITVVRGYLAEQFDALLYKYPNIRFIENPAYNDANNISSALVARYLLQNAYVLEADLLLRKPSLIRRYQYSSNYLAIKKDRSDDWCFRVRDGVITEMRVGGLDCYQTVGISYWTREDGRKLAAHLGAAYDTPGGRELFWDMVPLQLYRSDYRVGVRLCHDEDIVEIDSFKELCALDPSYDV